jgi:hypothetical protein
MNLYHLFVYWILPVIACLYLAWGMNSPKSQGWSRNRPWLIFCLFSIVALIKAAVEGTTFRWLFYVALIAVLAVAATLRTRSGKAEAA